jgi:hypothetical protein
MIKTLTKTGAAVVALFLALAFAAVAIPAKAHATSEAPTVGGDHGTLPLGTKYYVTVSGGTASVTADTFVTIAGASISIASESWDGDAYVADPNHAWAQGLSTASIFTDGTALAFTAAPSGVIGGGNNVTVGAGTFTNNGVTFSTTANLTFTTATQLNGNVEFTYGGSTIAYSTSNNNYTDWAIAGVSPTVTFPPAAGGGTPGAPGGEYPSVKTDDPAPAAVAAYVEGNSAVAEAEAVNAAAHTSLTVEATADSSVYRTYLVGQFAPGEETYVYGFSTPTYLGGYVVGQDANGKLYADVDVSKLPAGLHTLAFYDDNGNLTAAVTLDLRVGNTAAGFGVAGGLAILVTLIGAAGVAASRKRA